MRKLDHAEQSADSYLASAPCQFQEEWMGYLASTGPLTDLSTYWKNQVSESTEKFIAQTDLSHEKNGLLDLARKNLSCENMQLFEKHVEALLDRAKKEGLDRTEIANTFKQISRLFNEMGTGPLTPTERYRLAQQVMAHASQPTGIDQGNHGTCSVNALEVRTYTREPSKAARLVVDVALSGQYASQDAKTTLSIDPKPHGESKTSKPDGSRDHASEIFQTTAINLFHKANGKNIRYEQHEPDEKNPDDTGERLLDYTQQPPKLIGSNSGLYAADCGKINHMITGKKEEDVVLQHKDSGIEGKIFGRTLFSSEQEFHKTLQRLKEQKKFPVILSISTYMEPFNTDAGGQLGTQNGGKHAVTITDFLPGPPPRVLVDNSMGDVLDHNNSETAIALHDLYLSTLISSDLAKALKADLDRLARAQLDISKEFTRLRLLQDTLVDHKNDPYDLSLKRGDYVQGVKQLAMRVMDSWGLPGVDKAQSDSQTKINEMDEKRLIQGLIDLTKPLPMRERMGLLKSLHTQLAEHLEKRPLAFVSCMQEIIDIGVSLTLRQRETNRSKAPHERAEYLEDAKIFDQFLDGLDRFNRDFLRKQIRTAVRNHDKQQYDDLLRKRQEFRKR